MVGDPHKRVDCGGGGNHRKLSREVAECGKAVMVVMKIEHVSSA